MVRLANARQASGNHTDAVTLYQKAIEIMEQVRSATDPEVAAILVPLAVSHRAVGANEQAEESLARGLAIWEASVGPDHPVTIATLKPLALVRLALRKNDAALPLMARLLASYDADPATPQTDTIKLLKKLAQIHETRGEAEIARSYLERAVAGEAAAYADDAKEVGGAGPVGLAEMVTMAVAECVRSWLAWWRRRSAAGHDSPAPQDMIALQCLRPGPQHGSMAVG